MSSHHVVREKQEPALLIAGLDNFDDELLGQLLEWSPTVIVTADTAEKVQSYGIKIDWLMADGITELHQSDIKLLPAGDDEVVTALQQLITKGYNAVNIVTDNLDLDSFAAFVDRIDLIIFYNKKKIVALRSGFSKWKPAGDRLKFLTLPDNFLYTNLSPLAHSEYEITTDGFYSLQFSNDFVFVEEDL